jgi:hypothetical protein
VQVELRAGRPADNAVQQLEESVEAYNNNPLYAEDGSKPGVIYKIPN